MTASLRRALLLATVLLLAGPALGHQSDKLTDEEGNSFQPLVVTNRTALAGSLGAYGSEVVFASPMENGTRVGLWLVDIETEQETLLHQVRTPDELTFESLDYDGRHVVWSDDRSGSLQVYTVDTEHTSFRALTDSQSDQKQVAVDGGVVVWSSWGDFTVNALDLEDGTRYSVGAGAGVGPASAPDIHGDRVVWSRSVGGTNFEIFYRDLATGELARLSYDPLLQTTPKIWGDIVVWVEGHLPASFQEAQDPNASGLEEGTRVVAKDISTNHSTALTPDFGKFHKATVAGEWAAWLVQPGGLAVDYLPHGRLGLLPAPAGATTDVVLTEDYLVFTLRGADGLQVFAEKPTHVIDLQLAGQASDGRGGLLLAGLGVAFIAGGIGFGVWYDRRSGKGRKESS